MRLLPLCTLCKAVRPGDTIPIDDGRSVTAWHLCDPCWLFLNAGWPRLFPNILLSLFLAPRQAPYLRTAELDRVFREGVRAVEERNAADRAR